VRFDDGATDRQTHAQSLALGGRIGGMSWRIDIMASIGRGGARARSGRCGSDRGARGADKGAEPAGPAALALVSGP